MENGHDDNVEVLPVATTLPIPPERILKGALNVDFQEAVVLGWREDGSMYLAFSNPSLGDLIYILEAAKAELLKD